MRARRKKGERDWEGSVYVKKVYGARTGNTYTYTKTHANTRERRLSRGPRSEETQQQPPAASSKSPERAERGFFSTFSFFLAFLTLSLLFLFLRRSHLGSPAYSIVIFNLSVNIYIIIEKKKTYIYSRVYFIRCNILRQAKRVSAR